MIGYRFRDSGEMTHCGCDVDWEDCQKHDSCYVTVCQICGVRDYDCEA